MKTNAHVKKAFLTLRKTLLIYTWWEITIFVIGSLSLIALLVVLFLPIGNGASQLTYAGDVPEAGSTAFTHMLSESLNIPQRQGEPIQIIDNGDAFLKSFLTDIDGAHSNIDIMVYIWTEGKMSDQVLDHLDRKLKEGVQVRIMIDAAGSATNKPDKQFSAFTDVGGKIAVFHTLTVAPWDILRNQARNHRRAIVIDGNIGYTGGMTVNDSWLGDARNPKEYRDMMFRTTGSMAHDIQGAFGQLWTSTTGELLAGDTFYPEHTSTQAQNSFTYISLASVPSPDNLALQKFIVLSLLGAQKKIYIRTPYFLPDQSLRKALIEKAQAGLDVRVLVPDEHNDVPSVRYASRYSYEDLLEAGVKIYEYQPTFIHTKTISIDGDWSIIGSANMDNRSRKLNDEDIFGVSDTVFGTALEDNFLKDVANATQIDPTEWKKRGLWERVREVFDQKFIQQY